MLRYNAQTAAWVLDATSAALVARAKAIGMDQSAPATLHKGHPVYFTREPYAALDLWDVADAGARQPLTKLQTVFTNSYETQHRGFHYPCPSDREFMPLQDAAIAYALEHPHVVIGDEVGVGKTPTAIGIANEMQAKRVLVVCPANVRIQWAREVRGWSTIKNIRANPHWAYTIQKSKDTVSPWAPYTIISYDLIRNDEVFRRLMEMRFDLLVADEIHYCKEVSAQRSVRLFGDLKGDRPGLASRCAKVLGLTGTFLPNRPKEAYLTGRHLCWDAFDWISQDAFEHRFNPSCRRTTEEGKTFRIEKRGRLPELRARMRCNFLVRRTKRDPEVLRQLAVSLPAYELIRVEPNGAIREALKAESLLDIDLSKLEELDFSERGHIATVRRQMGIAKVPRIIQHAQMLRAGGMDKLVIFAYHREVIHALARGLNTSAVIIGGMGPVAKQAVVDRFIADHRCHILVGQMQAAGTGTDGLQKVCNWMLLPEPSWSPGDNEQIAGRIGARRGQTRDVTIQILVAPGSLDERILGAALEKLHITTDTLDGV